MKHIKQYEGISNLTPQIGDYVLCHDTVGNKPELIKFVDNNIGKITFIRFDEESYHVKYYNIPDEIIDEFTRHEVRLMYKEEIVEFSPDIDYIKSILSSKKYNL